MSRRCPLCDVWWRDEGETPDCFLCDQPGEPFVPPAMWNGGGPRQEARGEALNL